MFVETCSLGCSSGQGGSQVFCSIVNTSQNQEIAVLFSNPVDPLSVNASSFRVVKVATGTTPLGTFVIDALNPRRLIFRPDLSFGPSGIPEFGLEANTAYQITIPGESQGDNPPFITSTAGRPNQSRLQCTILTDQPPVDPVPGPPTVELSVTVVTATDSMGNPIAFQSGVALDGANDVWRFSLIEFLFHDIMNPATLLNPSTGQSSTIFVQVDGDDDLATVDDRSPVAGRFEVDVDIEGLSTLLTFKHEVQSPSGIGFVPTDGFPSSGPCDDASCSNPPLRRIVVDLRTSVQDLVGNALTGSNGGGVSSFHSERINFDELTLPNGPETFDISPGNPGSGGDEVRGGAIWGQTGQGGVTRLARGIGGGAGRLGDLFVGVGATVVLNTDSQAFPLEGNSPDILGNADANGLFPGDPQYDGDGDGMPDGDFIIEDGNFEFNYIIVDAGGTLLIEGSNAARIFSRGQAIIVPSGRISVAGMTPSAHDSAIALPVEGKLISDLNDQQSTTWGVQDVEVSVGVGGPNAGRGGFGADRWTYPIGTAFQLLGLDTAAFPASDALDIGAATGINSVFTDGRDGQGVGINALGQPSAKGRGRGGVKFPPEDYITNVQASSAASPITYNEINLECRSRQVGGAGSGGAYSTDGGVGRSGSNPPFSLDPPDVLNNGPDTGGGDSTQVGLAPPSEDEAGYNGRHLDFNTDPTFNLLRGGAGGGGGGNHPFGTMSNGNSGCAGPSSQVLEWHDHSGASGGGGGGALQFVSGVKIRVSGVIDASGGNGGSSKTFALNPDGRYAAPGGGGSGGGIKLQSITVELSGLLDVRGGAGGEGPFPLGNSVGGVGGAGLVRIEDSLQPALTRLEKRMIWAPFIAPFENTVANPYSIAWVSIGPGEFVVGGTDGTSRHRPDSFTASPSCWIKPAGNFFALNFAEDVMLSTNPADMGWNMDVVWDPGSGEVLVPYRGIDQDGPFTMESFEAMFGNLVNHDQPAGFGSPIAVRFQGAQAISSSANLCAIPVNGVADLGDGSVATPIISGSLTPWVDHPAKLNELIGYPLPNMIRFVVLFDTNLLDQATVDSIKGVTNLYITAKPN